MTPEPSLSPVALVPEFELQVGAFALGDLSVVEFQAEEALSRLFSVVVTVIVPPDAELDPLSLVGANAALVIHPQDSGDRYFNGSVERVRTWEEGSDDQRRRLQLWLGPSLARLQHQRDNFIFQNQTVQQIVDGLLGQADIDRRWELTADYPTREYCVQYSESDFAFISRLLEENGIAYFFEHSDSGHMLVLTDDPSSFQPIDGAAELSFREQAGMATEGEYVHGFVAQAQVRPDAVTLRDFNHLTPGIDLTASGGDGLLEIYEYPGGYGEGGVGDSLAQIRLQEAQVEAATFEGSSWSRRISPGRLFDLAEHPLNSLNRRYLLLSISHRGNQAGIFAYAGGAEQKRYQNTFACVAEEVRFRPTRITPRPILSGPQTAIVVGPASEEIHTDEGGRVKVQFHWDRVGQNDENSSCWVRVSQAWAGPGWGALYLPRIGHEVVVEFLDGDPDRPLITGSVYNGANPPPILLPDHKTKSTLRSATTPGGSGSNELRFEDSAGEEEVYLHAQRNLTIAVENDKTQTIGGNERLTVSRDRSRTISGGQTLQVGKDDAAVVGGNQTITVGGDRIASVGGNDSLTVSGDQTVSVMGLQAITVGAAATETVGLAKALFVGGAYAVTVGAALTESVGADLTELVAGAATYSVGGNRSETVAGNRSLQVSGDLSDEVSGATSHKIGKDLVINVEGKLSQASKDSYSLQAKSMVLAADQGFVLKVGSATFEVKKNGDIVIKGAKVEVNASGAVTLKGQTIAEN